MAEPHQSIDMTEVTEVKEFVSKNGDTNGLNAYLRAGWVLFAAHTVGIAERDGQQLVYSVAWLRANGEPVHPEFKTQMEEWLEKYEAEDA
jgi:hypothetical protein